MSLSVVISHIQDVPYIVHVQHPLHPLADSSDPVPTTSRISTTSIPVKLPGIKELQKEQHSAIHYMPHKTDTLLELLFLCRGPVGGRGPGNATASQLPFSLYPLFVTVLNTSWPSTAASASVSATGLLAAQILRYSRRGCKGAVHADGRQEVPHHAGQSPSISPCMTVWPCVCTHVMGGVCFASLHAASHDPPLFDLFAIKMHDGLISNDRSDSCLSAALLSACWAPDTLQCRIQKMTLQMRSMSAC